MKIRIAFILLFGSLMLWPPGSASAASVRRLGIDEIVREAELIFQGRVVLRESRRVRQGDIVTYVTFELVDILKGSFTGSRLTLEYLGGTAGSLTLNIPEVQIPQTGEEGIYFVETLKSQQVHPLIGFEQGHFLIKANGDGVWRVLTHDGKPISALRFEPPPKEMVLSDGVAFGVLRSSGNATGLSLADFKFLIRKEVRTR